MPRLDAYTLSVVTVFNLLATSAAMYLIWTLNKRVAGMRRCALANLLVCIGVATSPLTAFTQGTLFVVLSNVAIFAGGLCLLDGIRSFRGFRRETGIYVVIAIGFTSCACYWLFVDDRISSRVALVSVFGALLAFSAAQSLAEGVPPRDRRVYWSTAFIFGFDGFAFLARAGHALLRQPDPHVFEPGIIDLVGFVALNLSAAGCAFGLSMATILRFQRDTELLAFQDALTGLPNRRMFEERLEHAEARCYETGQRIALVYCDLDDFKGINDTLGHEGGDKALRLVGDRLRQVVGKDVCLARVGGDEFVLLIENPRSRDHVHGLIERLRHAVEGGIEFEGRSASLKISCGLAMYPDDVGSVSDLIRLADAAMYMMKQHGRSPIGGEPLRTSSGKLRSI